MVAMWRSLKNRIANGNKELPFSHHLLSCNEARGDMHV